MFFDHSNEPIIIQRYLPEVRKGDCRVIMINGEIAGAVNRVPPIGETRSNLHVGGIAEKKVLSNNEMEMMREDRRDHRVDRQAEHQKQMINQRGKQKTEDDSLKNSESSGNDIVTGDAGLEGLSL